MHARQDARRQETEAFASDLHRGRRRASGGAYMPHLRAVAGLAERLGRRLYVAYDGVVLPAHLQEVEAMWHAGMLHSAVERCGVSWDEVAQRAGLEAAHMVAEVSRDGRLPRPRRIHDRVSQLGQAGPGGQIVALADATHNLEEAILGLKLRPQESFVFLELWLDDAIPSLDAIWQLGENERLRPQWIWCRQKASQLREAQVRFRKKLPLPESLYDDPPYSAARPRAARAAAPHASHANGRSAASRRR